MRRRIEPGRRTPRPTRRPPPLAWAALALVLSLAYWCGGWAAALTSMAAFVLGMIFDDVVGATR